MSKNFELLRQANREQELLGTPSRLAVPTNGRRGRLDLEALTREEGVKLVQRVFLAPHSSPPRVVVFSGINHGDGCSSICAYASEILADQVAGSVCAVDANLRSPFLHEYFGVDNHRGVTDALLQPGTVREFAQRLSRPNLWLLPCGPLAPDLKALLTPDRLRLVMTELRAQFDYVLIDTAPLNVYADAGLLGQVADGLVMILKANSTRRQAAWKAKENLEAVNVHVVGTVLNRRTFPIPEALYRKL